MVNPRLRGDDGFLKLAYFKQKLIKTIKNVHLTTP